MMKARKNELRKAMMADWWDVQDAPAYYEVQVKVRSGMFVNFLNLKIDGSEYASLPGYQYNNNESGINRCVS